MVRWSIGIGLLPLVALAQLEVQLILSPEPSPYLVDWQQRRETAVLVVHNSLAQPVDVRLWVRIYRGMTPGERMIAQTIPESMPVLSLPPGTHQFDAAVLLPLEAIEFYGGIEEVVQRTGRIPAGIYTFCVQLVDAETLRPLLAEQCQNFVLRAYERPVLLYPEHRSSIVLYPGVPLHFRWIGVVPTPPFPVIYQLRLVPWLPNQTLEAAWQQNPPILEVNDIRVTEYLLDPVGGVMQSERWYIWSVRAIDEQGRPIDPAAGWAEPKAFRIETADQSPRLHIVFPPAPCVGRVEWETQDSVIVVEWEAHGKFQFFELVVSQNPCGRFRFAPADENEEVEKEPRRTPALEGERYRYRVQIPAETGKVRYQVEVPLFEAVAPGEAFVLGLVGVTALDSIAAEPRCGRYRPWLEWGRILVPVQECPPPPTSPPTTAQDTCTAGYRKLQGKPISLGVYLENADVFPYPRAVALSADAVDWDVVRWFCQPQPNCPDTLSWIEIAIRDRISPRKYRWELIQGPGSLDQPFLWEDAQSLDSVRRQLREQLQRLRYREDSVRQKIQQLENRHSRLRVALRQLEQLQSALTDSLAEIQRRIQDQRTRCQRGKQILDSLYQYRQRLQDSLQLAKDSVRWYHRRLRSEPTLKEQQLQKEIQQKRQSIQQARDAIEQLRQQYAQQFQQRRQQQQQLLNTLRQQRQQVANMEVIAAAQQRKVLYFETLTYRLYGQYQGVARQYLEAKERLRRQGEQFAAQFCSQDSVQIQTLWLQIWQIDDYLFASLQNRSTAQQRQDSLFQQLLARLRQCCQHYRDSQQRSTCVNAQQIVRRSVSEYQQMVRQAMQQQYVIDTVARDSLRLHRDRLRQLHRGLFALQQGLRNLATHYHQLLRDDSLLLAQFIQQKVALERILEQRREEVRTLERALYDSVQRRMERFRRYQPQYLIRHQQWRERQQQIQWQLHLLIQHLSTLRQDTQDCRAQLSKLQSDSTQIADEQRRLAQRREQYRHILRSDSIDLPKLRAELDHIRQQQQGLQQQYQQIQHQYVQRKQLIAHGPKVYYIPPPLEVIMKDKGQFEQLKSQLENAELQLQQAREAKRDGQRELARLLEQIARNIERYRALQQRLEVIHVVIDSAKQRIRRAEQSHQKRLARQDSLIQRKAARLLLARQKVIFWKKTVDSLKQVVYQIIQQQRLTRSQLDQQLHQLSQFLQQQRQYDTAVQQSYQHLVQLRTALVRARQKQSDYQTQLMMAYNEQARQRALEDPPQVRFTLTRIERLEQQLTRLQEEIQRLDRAIDQYLDRYRQRGAQSQQQWQQVMQKIQAVQTTMRLLRRQDSLFGVTIQNLQFARYQLARWRVEELQLEQEQRALQQRRAAIDSAGKASVAKEQQAYSTVDDQRLKLEDQRAELERQVEQWLQQRDSLETLWDEAIQGAENDLREAQQKLRQFLLQEFQSVEFIVKIRVSVDDDVYDSYRSDDPPVAKIITLRYQGRREPVMQSTYPDVTPPVVKHRSGSCRINFTPIGQPTLIGRNPQVQKLEPRTIALWYRKGKPLWREWPVIPSSVPMLAKDVVVLHSGGEDRDQYHLVCKTQCYGQKLSDAIAEVPKQFWQGEGQFYQIHHGNPEQQLWVYWEPPTVVSAYCRQRFAVKNDYEASRFAADKPLRDRRTRFPVLAGVLIEVPDTLWGWATAVDTITARIVQGDHTGLAGEQIRFSVRKIAGDAQGYGIGTDTVYIATTDSDGYAKVPFAFGDGYAKFLITVEWLRQGNCQSKRCIAIAPIGVQVLRFARGLSASALEAAKQMWQQGVGSFSQVVSAMPEIEKTTIYAIAGLFDEYPHFVNDRSVQFRTDDLSFPPQPDSVLTELFGMALTFIPDSLPDGGALQLTAAVSPRYRAVARPPVDSQQLSLKVHRRFWIGVAGKQFAVLSDEPFASGDEITGTGTLDISIGGVNMPLLTRLADLKLTLRNVYVQEQNGRMVAQSGWVGWTVPNGLTVQLVGFTLQLDSFVVRAQSGGMIGGQLQLPTGLIAHPLGFEAEVFDNGEFYGMISHLPEFDCGAFRIKPGAAVVFDWSTQQSVAGYAPDFRGVVIRRAQLVLPTAFRSNSSSVSGEITIQNFSITREGVQGSITWTDSLIIGFAGFSMVLTYLHLEFQRSQLVPRTAVIRGLVQLPKNVAEGSIAFTIRSAAGRWIGEVQTQIPVPMPAWEAQLVVEAGSYIEWEAVKQQGQMVISGRIQSDRIGELVVDQLRLTADGDVDISQLRLHTNAVHCLGGFSFQLQQVIIEKVPDSDELSLRMIGAFGFPAIGVQQLAGAITILPGPRIVVDSLQLDFEYPPFRFQGTLFYNNQRFAGAFRIQLTQPRADFSGTFTVGTHPIDSQRTFTFWYVGLALDVGRAGIPLGTTGLVLTELGGGLGWNVEPPSEIGTVAIPTYTDGFALLATAGIGTIPAGRFVNSRWMLRYTPQWLKLYGKIWLFDQPNTMFAEGTLNLYWSPQARNVLDGNIHTVITLPDADGSILDFTGDVRYQFGRNRSIRIESQQLQGRLCQLIQAEGTILVTDQRVDLQGRLWYHFASDHIRIGNVLTLIVDFQAEAQGRLQYQVQSRRLHSRLGLRGMLDVDLETPLGTANIFAAQAAVNLQITASPGSIIASGQVTLQYDVWVYRGQARFDVGFRL